MSNQPQEQELERPETTTQTTELERASLPTAARERLPDTRQSVIHKFNVCGTKGYITVGLFPDGRLGELFIKIAKEGSTLSGLCDTIGIVTSLGLQYGVPLEALANKLKNTKFEPSGHTKNPDIKVASSLSDYIFRWLELEFCQVLPPDESLGGDL